VSAVAAVDTIIESRVLVLGDWLLNDGRQLQLRGEGLEGRRKRRRRIVGSGVTLVILVRSQIYGCLIFQSE
jgi:hypothetical protein